MRGLPRRCLSMDSLVSPRIAADHAANASADTCGGAGAGAQPPLIAMHGVSVDLGGHRVLSGIDMSVQRGQIVTVVGPNGSGKTTLMRAIIGTLSPSEGRIVRAPGLRLSYVPQRLAIDPSMPMTVSRFMNLPRRRAAADIAAALTDAGMAGSAPQPLTSLSGGQLQRVLLARALLNDPDLLILDEGTAGLDQPGVAAFYARIERVRAQTGCAVLMVSHDLQIVMRASDHVICLNGHICCEGTPETVSSSPVYRGLFGAQGTLAIYRHHHSHSHDDDGICEAGEAGIAPQPGASSAGPLDHKGR